jgi:protein-tyrosine-phosphatase
MRGGGRRAKAPIVMTDSCELRGAPTGEKLEKGKAAELRGWIVRRVKDEGRRVVGWMERRRAETSRRKPERVTRRLRRARTILILCQGNVSRSVFATQVLATAVRDNAALSIRSAGLATEPGWRAHPRVVARCQALNIDVRSHRSVAVTAEMIKAADVVFVMEVSQLVAMTRRFLGARRKTFLLACLASDVPMDIEDPAGKPDPEVDACLDHVTRALEPVIGVLVGRKSSAP